MIDQLPEGESIGWMQAPPQWIFSHTVRFVGVVRIVIQDGEGFILIRKGTPLAYYFKHGRIELKGHAALDYFNSHPTIEFNLCKYTAEEFAQALKICNIDDPVSGGIPEVPHPTGPAERIVTPPAPAPAPAPEPAVPAQVVPAKEQNQIVMQQATWPSPPEPVAVQPAPAPREERPAGIPQPLSQVIPQASPEVVLDAADIKIIGQIKKLNGIVAISIFSEDRNIILMGDVEIEPLLKIARSMLETTRKITPYLDWGTFVHMTLQIPEGNVIVASYGEYHLCLLTTRTINIGHIRRILRDLQQTGLPE
jgi:hypothetical protein